MPLIRQVDAAHLNKPLTTDVERRFFRGAEDDLRVLVKNQIKAIEMLAKAAEDMEVRADPIEQQVVHATALRRVIC